MKQVTLDKYLNNQFGVLKVLSYSHNIGNRTFFNALCMRCSNITQIRSDHLNTMPKSCTYCIANLQKEIADNKYLHLRRFNKIYWSYVSNAKIRNIKMLLTNSEFLLLIDGNCFYCNKEKSNGIDRVDNEKDYTLDNSVSCCKICNFMKNNYTNKFFIDHINKIYNNIFKKDSTTIPQGSTSQVKGGGNGGHLQIKVKI